MVHLFYLNIVTLVHTKVIYHAEYSPILKNILFLFLMKHMAVK